MKKTGLILLITIFGWNLVFSASTSVSKAHKDLQTLLTTNHQTLKKIDQKLKKEVQRKRRFPSLPHLEDQVQKLSTVRREHLLRQDFLDRLKFQIDNNYKGKNLKGVIITALKKMTLIELKTHSQDLSLWKFLKYLTLSMESLLEPNENPIEFIEGYLKTSRIIRPMAPHIYSRTRNYSNGIDNEAANPVDQENIGDEIEKRLQSISHQSPQKPLGNSPHKTEVTPWKDQEKATTEKEATTQKN